jgi:hypothetical protein
MRGVSACKISIPDGHCRRNARSVSSRAVSRPWGFRAALRTPAVDRPINYLLVCRCAAVQGDLIHASENSEIFNKKNVNPPLNVRMPDAKITPSLKKRCAPSFAPQVGGGFYQLGFIKTIFARHESKQI